MCYGGKSVSKSICIVYHTEKQIVTKIFLSHSGFVFAIAKISKKFGFGKDFFLFFAIAVAIVAVVAVKITEEGTTHDEGDRPQREVTLYRVTLPSFQTHSTSLFPRAQNPLKCPLFHEEGKAGRSATSA